MSLQLTEKQIEDLVESAKNPKTGIPTKDHRYHFRIYKKCFTGTAAVDWLVRRQDLPSESRLDAVAVYEELLKRGYLHHITNEHPFRDANFFYKWKKNALNEDEDFKSVGQSNPTRASFLSGESQEWKFVVDWMKDTKIQADLDYKDIKFHNAPIETSIQQSREEKDKLFILALGVLWCYPARKTLEHVDSFCSKNLARKIELRLFNQDQNKQFCADNELVVGCPSVFFYFRGKIVPVHRGHTSKGLIFGTRTYWVGALNSHEAGLLIDAAYHATKTSPRDGFTLDW